MTDYGGAAAPVSTTALRILRGCDVERGADVSSARFSGVSGAYLKQSWSLDQQGNWAANTRNALAQARTHNPANQLLLCAEQPNSLTV